MGDFVYYYREIEGGNLFFGRFCCCLFLVGLVLFLYLFLGCFEVLGSCCFFLLVILLLMFFDCILRIGVGVEFCLVFLLFWFGRLEKYFKSYYGDWIQERVGGFCVYQGIGLYQLLEEGRSSFFFEWLQSLCFQFSFFLGILGEFKVFVGFRFLFFICFCCNVIFKQFYLLKCLFSQGLERGSLLFFVLLY